MNMDSFNLTTPEKTYTIDQFIASQTTDDITYYNFSILEKIGNVEHLDHNIAEDYLPELMQLAVDVPLTDEQYRKYCMRPDLLAYDIYGSNQLDAYILMINDMCDPKDFINKTIKLVKKSQFVQFFSQVYAAELKYLNYNRNKVWAS